MPASISIKPFDKSNKPQFTAPHDALSFIKYQMQQKCSEKHFKITLVDQDENKSPCLIDFEVVDGAHKRNTVQLLINKYQCSCEEFIKNQTGFCEHSLILEFTRNNSWFCPGGYEFNKEINKRLKTSNLYASAFTFYDPIESKTYLIKDGTDKQVKLIEDTFGYVESVSTHTYKNLLNKYSIPTSLFSHIKVESKNILHNGINLYNYQEEIFEKMIKTQKAICAMSVGSGKSLTTIACLGWLKKNYKQNIKALIICPKSLKLQWKKEILRGIKEESRTINSEKDLLKDLSIDSILIMTYQLYQKHYKKINLHQFDFVVMDEIQFIRNDESKIWKAAKELRCDFFYGLSGTVIENKLDDLYSIMDVVAPQILGPKWKFSNDFQELVTVNKKTIVFKGAKNLDILKKKIDDYVFSYNGLVLPGITHSYLPVGMNAYQAKQHDSYYGEAKRILAKSLTSGLSYAEKMILQSYLLKARQACNSETLLTKIKTPTPSPKLTEILSLILKNHSIGKKVLLFSQWTEMLDLISDLLKIHKIEHLFYTGKESEKKRVANIDKFTNDQTISVLLASDSGGIGVDGLQQNCHVVIHSELPWNPAKLDQRNGRVHRLGQTNSVEIYYFYAISSIEETMIDMLNNKRNIRSTTIS